MPLVKGLGTKFPGEDKNNDCLADTVRDNQNKHKNIFATDNTETLKKSPVFLCFSGIFNCDICKTKNANVRNQHKALV